MEQWEPEDDWEWEVEVELDSDSEWELEAWVELDDGRRFLVPGARSVEVSFEGADINWSALQEFAPMSQEEWERLKEMAESTRAGCPNCGNGFFYQGVPVANARRDPARSKCPSCGTNLALERVPAERDGLPPTAKNRETCNLTEGTKAKADALLASVFGEKGVDL